MTGQVINPGRLGLRPL